MKSVLLLVVIGPLAPAVAYLALVESLYRWYESGLESSGTGMWLGGMLVALLSFPGDELGGYAHVQYWVNRLGLSDQPLSNYDRRFVEFHVPIFTTAALVYAVALLGLSVVLLATTLSPRRK